MGRLRKVNKIYVMTTNQKDFYLQMGFKLEENQYLMIKEQTICDLNKVV